MGESEARPRGRVLELGAHIAFENYRARYNRVFDVESDELSQPLTSLDGGPAERER